MNQLINDIRFATTIALGTDGVVIIDDEQNIIYFNDHAEIMFGYNKNEVIGAPLDLLLPKSIVDNHKTHINKFIESNEIGRPMARRQSIHARHASGYEFSIEASISQTTYNGRRYCTAVLRDLTPIRKIHDQLVKSQVELHLSLNKHKHDLHIANARLSEVQRLSQVGLWELDLKENSLYWSNEVFEIFDMDPNEFTASYEAFLAAIHPEDRELVNKVYTDSVSNRKPYIIQHRLLMKDKRIKFVEERCETFYDNKGHPIRSVGTIQDITSQISDEQHIKRLQNLLLRVENLAQIGCWEWSLNTNEVYWSPEIYQQYGLDPHSTHKPEFVVEISAIHADDRKMVEDHFKSASQAGSFLPIDYRIVRPNGEIRYMRAHGEIIKPDGVSASHIYGFIQDITSYIAAGKELRESNQLLEAIFDTTHISCAYIDNNFNYIRVNQAYAKNEKKPPDYFAGKNIFNIYPDSVKQEIFQKVLQSGRSQVHNAKPFEYKNIHNDNIQHWDWTITPIKSSQGDKVKALVLSQLEVTKRIHAIEALQENEEKLKVLNENLEDVILQRTIQLRDERNFIDTVLETQGALVIVLDNKGRIVRFNRACEEVSGYSFHELRDKYVWDYLIPVKEKESIEEIFTNLTSTALPSQFENHWLTKDGGSCLIQWSNSTMVDENGVVRFVIATGIDVTERRKTENKLRQSESSLQAAQRIAKVGSWEMDPNSGQVWWSDEKYRIFGKDKNTYTPTRQGFFESVIPDDLPNVKRAIESLIKDGNIDIIYKIVLSNGEQRVIHEVAETDYDSNGNACIVRGTVHDITELKKSEEERNQLQRQLQQAQKMESIGHLTGGIAHDFNNILAAVLGFTQLAISRFAPDRKGTLGSFLTEIETGGRRASDLVKQLLAFSRGDTQGHKIIEPAPIIKDSIKMLRSTIPTSININYIVPEENVYIQTDGLQLQQAIINLIINARDALSGKGDITVKIYRNEIKSQECISCHNMYSGKFITVEVSDNGTGIEKNILQRVFEPFFTTKKIGDGSGMGLALVHGFVHTSGGHIDIKTSQTKGTNILLHYPSYEIKNDLNNESGGVNDAFESPNKILDKHILVVDDEKPIVRLMKEILVAQNYKVTSTTSSSDALQIFSNSPTKFDLLITDQAMPELSGIELIHQIRQINPTLPIIICSGYSDLVNEHNYSAKLASRFLSKPIEPRDLLQSVSELIKIENKN